MPIFNLKKNESCHQWYRNYYKIEADTLNEAVNKILNDEVEAYDYEPIIECGQEPDFFEIIDEFDNTIYRSNE